MALWQVPHVLVGADGKVIIKRLCISLPYVETFNSKVIKGFVPELRSCYVFFVFRDSYVLCICALWTLWTFYVWVWICLFLVFISGYGTSGLFSNFLWFIQRVPTMIGITVCEKKRKKNKRSVLHIALLSPQNISFIYQQSCSEDFRTKLPKRGLSWIYVGRSHALIDRFFS